MQTPELANGTVAPDSVKNQQFLELKEEAQLKKQFRHDWYLACFSIATGAISGLISSFIFWLVTNSQV